MKRRIFFITIMSIFLMVSLASLVEANGKKEFKGFKGIGGAVYAMTNDTENSVVVYTRNSWGKLTYFNSYLTEGMGTGVEAVDPLASQGSLILSQDNRWLFAVNAESNDISVFRVLPKSLVLTCKVDSEGTRPTSLTFHHNQLYVLNAGIFEEPHNADVPANITGFTLSWDGILTPIAGSGRSLGTGAFSQVGFDPWGKHLVVTDRGGNKLLVFPIDNGIPGASYVESDSVGDVPFGFIFDHIGNLLVVEASGGVTAYKILSDNMLTPLDSVPNGQNAACWIIGDGRGFVYTANTASDTISLYNFNSKNETLNIIDAATATTTGEKPIDMAAASGGFYGSFLYALNDLDGTIGMYRIKLDGSLQDLGSVSSPSDILTHGQGIAAR